MRARIRDANCRALTRAGYAERRHEPDTRSDWPRESPFRNAGNAAPRQKTPVAIRRHLCETATRALQGGLQGPGAVLAWERHWEWGEAAPVSREEST
jgi:hypothetical protein